MKIIFNKDIHLNCAEAYLRIKKQVERKDIQEYLNGKIIKNQLIDDRIQEYLKSKHILAQDGSLTPVGIKVKDTGKIGEYEEGKYRFWYVNTDNFLDTKILYFERVEAYPSDNRYIGEIYGLDIKNSKHFLLKDKNIVFEVKSDKIYGQKLNEIAQINFKWIWEGLEKSFYDFNGKIKKDDINSGRIPQQFQLKEEILKWIDWDTTYNRLKWRLEFNENTLKLPIFEDFIHDYEFKKDGFHIEVQDAPIMPVDKTHAEEWRNLLLLKQVEQNYLSEEDFKYESRIIGEKEGLKMYELTEPDRVNFLKRRENSINQKWHLQAPMDLNPNKYLPLMGTPISFEKGIEFHFENFVSCFPSDFQNPDYVIISDLYAITKRNIKMLDSFLSVIRSKRNIVISNKKDDREDDYYLKDYQKIKEKSELVVAEHIYETKKDVFHDRGIVLVKNKKYYILTGTGSFNTFLEWDNNKKSYKTRRSITYTPISEKYYDSKLMNFIKEKYEN